MKRWSWVVAVIAFVVVAGLILTQVIGTGEEVAAPETTTTVAPTTTTVAPTTTTVAPTTTTVAPTTTQAPTTTTVPPTTTTQASDEIETSPVVPGEDEEVDAIVEAYVVVFDSALSYDEKAPFITDPDGLEETMVKYTAAGDDVGGIGLQADEVGIDGSDARVIYSFLFAGNPAYTDLEGTAVMTDAGWQISREFFCEIMTLARVGCP